MPPTDAASLSDSDHLLARLSVEHCTSGATLRLIDEHGVCEIPLPSETLPIIRRAIEIMSKDLAVYFEAYPSVTTVSYAAKLARVSEEFVEEGVASGQIRRDALPKADGSPGDDHGQINMNDVWKLTGTSESYFLPPDQRTRLSERVRDLVGKRKRPVGMAMLIAGEVVALPPEVLDVARFVTEAMFDTRTVLCNSMPLEITEEQAVWVINSHIAFVKDELDAGRIDYTERDEQRWVCLRSTLKRTAELSEKQRRSWREIDEILANPGAPVRPRPLSQFPVFD